jgi:hypothetical protein
MVRAKTHVIEEVERRTLQLWCFGRQKRSGCKEKCCTLTSLCNLPPSHIANYTRLQTTKLRLHHSDAMLAT